VRKESHQWREPQGCSGIPVYKMVDVGALTLETAKSVFGVYVVLCNMAPKNT
jgi:hypothetical protein